MNLKLVGMLHTDSDCLLAGPASSSRKNCDSISVTSSPEVVVGNETHLSSPVSGCLMRPEMLAELKASMVPHLVKRTTTRQLGPRLGRFISIVLSSSFPSSEGGISLSVSWMIMALQTVTLPL